MYHGGGIFVTFMTVITIVKMSYHKYFEQTIRRRFPEAHQAMMLDLNAFYASIQPDVGFAKTSSNPMDRRLDFSAYFLATIQVLEQRGEPFERIRELCLEITQEYLWPKNSLQAWLKRLPVKIIRSPLGGLLTRFMKKKTTKLGHSDGFRVKLLTDPSLTFGLGYGIDILECGICKLFNASKAYVKQLDKGREYKGLKPVYALSLVNENFERDTGQYYHHYSIIHNELSGKKIDGLEFVFVELPKFKAKNLTEKKLQVLWLRYLTEIEDNADLLANPDVREAIECLRESAFTRAELETYDNYWDRVSTEKTLMADALDSGKKEGLEEGLEIGKEIGREEGKEIGREEGREEGIQLTLKVIRLRNEGLGAEAIAAATGQPLTTVQQLLREAGL